MATDAILVRGAGRDAVRIIGDGNSTVVTLSGNDTEWTGTHILGESAQANAVVLSGLRAILTDNQIEDIRGTGVLISGDRSRVFQNEIVDTREGIRVIGSFGDVINNNIARWTQAMSHHLCQRSNVIHQFRRELLFSTLYLQH